MKRIYLDHNSTTPIHPQVIQAMISVQEEQLANPASQHQSGQLARRRLEVIRSDVIQRLGGKQTGMDADQLVFTSGGTESNNLAMVGMVGKPPGRVLVSAIEHPSIFGPAEWLSRMGFEVISIPVNGDGVCRIESAESLLNDDTRLVSLMLANNETGVIQPARELFSRCAELGISTHCDATQAVGKIPVSFADLGCDAMTFSAHKFYGPRGIGCLMFKKGIELKPILFGGFQQSGIRPGTEDTVLATGLLEALKVSSDVEKWAKVAQLRLGLEQGLVERCSAVINGVGADRLPHTTNASFAGINRQELLMAADMLGLDLSTGSACASGSSEPSPVLMAMNLENSIIEGSIRISLGLGNTKEEIELVIDKLESIVSRQSSASNEGD